VKVMPRDYKRALAELATREQDAPMSGVMAASADTAQVGDWLEAVPMSARPTHG
jgi:hypothetical protein